MKRKKPAIRSKILTFLLFSASQMCIRDSLWRVFGKCEAKLRAGTVLAVGRGDGASVRLHDLSLIHI